MVAPGAHNGAAESVALWGGGRGAVDALAESEGWVEINQKYADLWPVITQKKDPMPDHSYYGPKNGSWDPTESKTHLLSEKPGEGD